jgi:hypothetical protein
VDIFDERGRHVGRVDFLWPAYGVIGEADGWSKYRRPDVAGTELEVLRAEKTREDRLRDLGYELVRWTSVDIIRPQSPVTARIQRAVARARPGEVRGHRRTTASPPTSVVRAGGLRALAMLSDTGMLLSPRGASYSLMPGDAAS